MSEGKATAAFDPGEAQRDVEPIHQPDTHGETIELFRCDRCGERIGVYEPVVVKQDSGARVTSRTAEPNLRAFAAGRYHRDCYETLDERSSSATRPR